MRKVACLGAGYFSQFHLEAWRRIAGVTLVGLHDQDAAKAGATGLPTFPSLDAMLTHARPDILDIIVPPPGHGAAIRSALDHGVKTIICQKPFCASATEARSIVQAAEQAGATLLVHENFRFQPWYRAIKTHLDQGDIGTVLQATFRLRPGDGQGPDAYLARQPYFQKMERFLIHETAVHWVDTFRFLFGNPGSVYADLRRINPAIAGEDAGVVVFDHPGGVRALFDGNRSLDHSAQNTRCTMGEGLFEGTAGTLRLDGDGSVHRRAFGSLNWTQLHPADQTGIFGGDCVYHLQNHVVEALAGHRPFENLAHDYLTVIEIEQAIYASAARRAKLDL